MANILHLTEWETPSGWHCGDVSALAAGSNYWWNIPRMLNISMEDYIHLLLSYHAINLHYSAKCNVLSYCFSTQQDCRKFKNYINKMAREKNFVAY